MAKHRTHSIEFKRQVCPEYIGGETLHGLSKRHDISRNLIRIRVEKHLAGALEEDVAAADLHRHALQDGKGFRRAGILEVVENDAGGTYRAVYTVRFEEAVFVLYCFQKKGKSDIATPKADMDLVRARLKMAEAVAKEMRDAQPHR